MPKEWFLIDDDVDDQEIFLMALRELSEDIHCSLAFNGVEGVQKLAADSYVPDRIFIDINMHKMNGLECLQRIKLFEHLAAVPVIMISTSSDPSILQQCKELGADDFVVKPAGLEPLVASLRKFLKGM